MITCQSDALIANSLFVGNHAEVGGAICLMASSNVTITNSVLTNNSINKFHTSMLS